MFGTFGGLAGMQTGGKAGAAVSVGEAAANTKTKQHVSGRLLQASSMQTVTNPMTMPPLRK
jgi:hypothetical protein